MNFIVTGIDFKDSEALERRMKARDAHMANIEKMKAEGTLLYAVAHLNQEGNMAGSTLILEMENEKAVEDYLEKEAYVLGKV
ncbi:MAG: hypothetical protein JXR88_03875 [Clostridia bacterium]|nr:hypothetical protein [Clostridia bacterium]